MPMKLTIIDIACHRNGVCGAPFDVVLFEDHGPQGSRKLVVLFADAGYCVVLDMAKLTASDIAFGSNSWRGDCYESPLRSLVGARHRRHEPTVRQREQGIAHVLSWCGRGALSENLIDLLSGARHWCDANGESFAALDRQAYQHYLAELNDPTNERNQP